MFVCCVPQLFLVDCCSVWLVYFAVYFKRRRSRTNELDEGVLPAGEMLKTTTNLFTHFANSYLSGNGGMSECVSE